jgi:hypothetical protein
MLKRAGIWLASLVSKRAKLPGQRGTGGQRQLEDRHLGGLYLPQDMPVPVFCPGVLNGVGKGKKAIGAGSTTFASRPS